jgi:undecaprenyl-diphosphatase
VDPPTFGLNPVARRWGMAAAVVLLGVVLVIGIRVSHTSGPLHVDRLGTRVVDSSRVAGELARHHLGALNARRVLHRVVWLGSPTFVGASIVVLALWRIAARDVAGAAVAILGPLAAGVLTELVAKPLIDRRLHGGLAFPSGHVTGATALAAVAVSLAVRQWGPRAAWAGLPAVLVPLGVSAGVVRAGFHYATDAVGGIAMGLAAVLLVVVAVSSVEDRHRRRVGARVTAARP